MAKGVVKRLPKYLNEEDIVTLLDVPYKTKTDDKLLMSIPAKCGLRNSETCNLKVEDIDIEQMTITVRQGKGKKDRLVPISGIGLLREIERYIKKENLVVGDKLFDITPKGLLAMVKRYAKRAGIEKNVTVHMLRHTFSVHSLKSGVNLRSLQKVLGHTSLSTTQIYLDVLGEDIIEDYQKHPLPY